MCYRVFSSILDLYQLCQPKMSPDICQISSKFSLVENNCWKLNSRDVLSQPTFSIAFTVTHHHDWANYTLQVLWWCQIVHTCMGVDASWNGPMLLSSTPFLYAVSGKREPWGQYLVCMPCIHTQFMYCFHFTLPLGPDPHTHTHTQTRLVFSLCSRRLNIFELLYSKNLCLSQD